MPASASAMAAVSPAGPPPTMATSTVNGFVMPVPNPSLPVRRGPETMIRAAVFAGAGNALWFSGDRFYPRTFAEPSVRDRSAAVDRAGAAEAHRIRLHRGVDRVRLAGAWADVRKLAAELAGPVPAGFMGRLG